MKSLIGYPALLAFFVSTPVPANASVRNGSEGQRIVSAIRIDPDGRIVCSGIGPGEDESLSYLRRPDPDLDTRLTYSASEDGGIRLQFSRVPAQAQEAVVFAASVWERYLVIDVPFTLRFNWKYLGTPRDFGPGPLAWVRSQWETGPDGSFSRVPENVGHFIFPNTLARQLLGYEVGADPSFEIDLNLGYAWYFGTDGKAPEDQLDLVSTVLHEIGHALGFLSGTALYYDKQSARLGTIDGYTMYFDEFVWWWHDDGKGELRFQVSSDRRRLFQVYTEGMVMWGHRKRTGTTNKRSDEYSMTGLVNGGPVALHTSAKKYTGSSHVSQALFGNTPNDHIMSPYGFQRKSRNKEYSIGPVTLAMLYDLGWQLKPRSPNQASCLVPIKPSPPKNVEMYFFWNPDRLQITWEIEPPATRSRVRGKGPGDDWSRWFEIDETSFEYEYSRFQGRKGRWEWEIAAGTDLDAFSDAVSKYYYYD